MGGEVLIVLGGAFLAMAFKASSSSLPGNISWDGALGGDAGVGCTPEQRAEPGVRALPSPPAPGALTVPQIWDQPPFPCLLVLPC